MGLSIDVEFKPSAHFDFYRMIKFNVNNRDLKTMSIEFVFGYLFFDPFEVSVPFLYPL